MSASGAKLSVENALVSVLVLAYKQEDLVSKCLDSVLALDYPRIEVIVSDDCSPDRTFQVADEWITRNRHRFVRAAAFKQPRNLGIVRNLQFLFDQAAGDYVTYIASDDLYNPSAIRDRLAVFERETEIDAVFGNAQEIAVDGGILKDAFIPKRFSDQFAARDLLLSGLILNWCVPGPVMMLRSSALREEGSLGRLPAGLKGEDAYIYIRLAAQNRLAFINKPVARWRYVPHSSSHAPSPSNVFSRAYTLESHGMNRHLLRGFDRLAINARMASDRTEVFRSRFVIYLAKKVYFRVLMLLLRFALRLRTIAATLRMAAPS